MPSAFASGSSISQVSGATPATATERSAFRLPARRASCPLLPWKGRLAAASGMTLVGRPEGSGDGVGRHGKLAADSGLSVTVRHHLP